MDCINLIVINVLKLTALVITHLQVLINGIYRVYRVDYNESQTAEQEHQRAAAAVASY